MIALNGRLVAPVVLQRVLRRAYVAEFQAVELHAVNFYFCLSARRVDAAARLAQVRVVSGRSIDPRLLCHALVRTVEAEGNIAAKVDIDRFLSILARLLRAAAVLRQRSFYFRQLVQPSIFLGVVSFYCLDHALVFFFYLLEELLIHLFVVVD